MFNRLMKRIESEVALPIEILEEAVVSLRTHVRELNEQLRAQTHRQSQNTTASVPTPTDNCKACGGSGSTQDPTWQNFFRAHRELVFSTNEAFVMHWERENMPEVGMFVKCPECYGTGKDISPEVRAIITSLKSQITKPAKSK